MLMQNSYELHNEAKQKNSELNRIAETKRLIKANDYSNNRKAVITQILEGTGKALITTGNKLLQIA